MAYGYHNYRGRGSKWKILLALLLGLVILGALSFLALQRYIAYDADGRPFFRLPEEETMPPEEEDPAPPDMGLEIQEPDPVVPETSLPGPLHLLASAAAPVTRRDWTVPAVPYDGAAVTVKDSTGKVYFPSAAAADWIVSVKEDTAATLEQLTGSSLYAVARLSCFHDPLASNADVRGMGLMNTGGYIFYDGNYSRWLDPGKPAARAYLCALARETAELGFDEILLTDVSYPTFGKLNKIDYGEAGRDGNLARFLEEVRTVLEPYGTALSIELTEKAVLEGADEDAGVRLAELLPLVDRVYVRTEQPGALAGPLSAVREDISFLPELAALPEALPEGDGYLVFE